jgi:hypothetical protein
MPSVRKNSWVKRLKKLRYSPHSSLLIDDQNSTPIAFLAQV